jgi:acyl-CoA synthetase (AMP-forming)/AMP-acid ligase II
MDISGWISRWGASAPDKPALRFEGTSISYRDLEDQVARAAGLLAQRGA